MKPFVHPRVVVGVDDSLSGLVAIRVAVAEARRRSPPLLAVRSCSTGITSIDTGTISAAFLEALGAMPTDVQVQQHVSVLPVTVALCTAAGDPGGPLRDLEEARPEFHGRPYSGI